MINSDILDGCAGWFMSFTDDISREQMSDMMDAEETGGMMEFWADLYARTGKAMHRELDHPGDPWLRQGL